MTLTPRTRLLLVEDDEDSRSMLAELLGQDFEVLVAPDAEVGLQMFLAESPSVVVTDESLPGMRGTELARAIKKHDANARVVLVSGYNHVLGAEACDVVMKKPLQFETLTQTLRGLVQKDTPP